MTDPNRELPPEGEEPVGSPSFALLARVSSPVVSGSYFMHPPLRAVMVAA